MITIKKLFSALFILLFGFGTSGNIVKASTMVEQTSEMAKTFSQLTPEEQSYFKSKGFSDKDTFYTQKKSLKIRKHVFLQMYCG